MPGRKNLSSAVDSWGGRNQTAQEILEIENVARSPILFSMETKEERMVAIYHSHPHTVPFRVL